MIQISLSIITQNFLEIFLSYDIIPNRLEADTVIIAVGTKSLVEERDKFIDTAFDVINVGDCVKASSIVHAVHTGFDAGWTL